MGDTASPQKPLGYYGVDNHGKYFQPAASLRAYRGGNQAAVATAMSAGLPTTYTGGLILYNPLASTSVLAINRVSFLFIVAQTNVSAIGLGLGYSGSVAPTGTLTVVASRSSNVGSSAPTAQGVLYSSASVTLPVAPYLGRLLGTVDTLTPALGVGSGTGTFDIAGGIILQPGAFCCFTSTAAGTASSFLGEFAWEEVLLGAS